MGLAPVVVPTEHGSASSASAGAGARSAGRNAPRRRYPPVVYDILVDYYEKKTKYPTREQYEQLAATIRNIPGCEDYTAERASHYFAGRRQSKGETTRNRRKETKAASSSAQIPNHASIVAKLDVLLKETPEPSMELAQIWARSLSNGVVPEDILTYADLRRIQRNHMNSASLPRVPPTSSQLPTPESSTSPEPHSTPTSPVVETSWGKVESEDEILDELQDDDYEDETASAEKYDPRCLLVAEEFTKAFGLPTRDMGEGTDMPKTFADLTKWFREQSAATSLLDTLGKPSSRQQPAPSRSSSTATGSLS
ncbi:hypothetical protein FKP32DRAFT_675261 [Trametes sanguinea]|nr:hypothetical protein FKP32DRAFT_675261 [Trametes sanguinea]